MTRRSASPLGHLIGPLLRGRLTPLTVIDRHCGDLGARVLRALTLGDLTSGQLDRVRPRQLDSRCARRILATLLMYCERADRHGVACGREVWQGAIARRLSLSLRARAPGGPLGGIREVQRYTAILESAGLVRASQPDAARVPDAMRARARLSIVRGASVVRRWAYNVIRLLADLPIGLRAVRARTVAIDHQARARAERELRLALDVATTTHARALATLEYLRARRPVPI